MKYFNFLLRISLIIFFLLMSSNSNELDEQTTINSFMQLKENGQIIMGRLYFKTIIFILVFWDSFKKIDQFSHKGYREILKNKFLNIKKYNLFIISKCTNVSLTYIILFYIILLFIFICNNWNVNYQFIIYLIIDISIASIMSYLIIKKDSKETMIICLIILLLRIFFI